MAGEGRMTATMHAAFTYTGSGYKKIKALTQTMAYASNAEAGNETLRKRAEGI
jgi:hypothetical protein